jgi:hypothetical protein
MLLLRKSLRDFGVSAVSFPASPHPDVRCRSLDWSAKSPKGGGEAPSIEPTVPIGRKCHPAAPEP